MLLFVDMLRKACQLRAAPMSLRRYGGRALASLSIGGKDDLLSPTGLPRGSACLVLARGLLAGTTCASAGRCAVVCMPPGGGRLGHSNAGGSVARALAGCGIKAVLIAGKAETDQLYDLIVDATGGRLVPVDPSDAMGGGVATVMRALALRWPNAAGIVVAGRAGRCKLPIASTTFSDDHLRPVSHAGSGSGAVMGGAGLRSVVILKTAGSARVTCSEKGERAEEAFLHALKACRSAAKSKPEGRCSAACLVECQRQPEGKASAHAKKWPGYEWWSCGNARRDAACTLCYATLCDEMGVDAFALSVRLRSLAEQGILPARNTARALREVRRLATNPADAMLLPWLVDWTPARKEETAPTEADRQAVIMDTLGICRFAMDAIHRVPDVARAFENMLEHLFGLRLAELQSLADETLRVERGLPAARTLTREQA